MRSTTKCPHCKETTYHRVGFYMQGDEFVQGRLCNLCDKPKPLRALTAAQKAKIEAREELIKRLMAE